MHLSFFCDYLMNKICQQVEAPVFMGNPFEYMVRGTPPNLGALGLDEV